jgi:hypothetical protein
LTGEVMDWTMVPVVAIPHYLQVLPTSEARGEMSATLVRFRREGLAAEPVVFGSHRRAEGVVLPFALFEAVRGAIEEVRTAALLEARMADGTPRVSLEDAIDKLGFDRADFDLA